MSRIAWEEKYSVNIEVIDEQHKKLFEIIGNLFDDLGKERDKEVLGASVGELARYAADHFSTEEIFLKQYECPGYERHRKEHDVFKTKVAAFQKDFEAGKATLSMEVVNFLTTWLQQHILKIDKGYSAFLNEKGVC